MPRFVGAFFEMGALEKYPDESGHSRLKSLRYTLAGEPDFVIERILSSKSNPAVRGL
jgi:hypothetical protein